MGLGDIVALALGGYSFVARFLLTRDRMVRWDGYEMLFVCGIVGVLLLGLTFPIASFAFNVLCLSPKGISLWTIAGVLGIPVGFVLATCLNNWPGMEKRRLRGLRALAESNSDMIEVLLDDAMQGDWYVELALETGKCYVGLPVRTAYATSSEVADVELIPLFSGDRTGETRELRLTRYYGDDIRRLVDGSSGFGEGAVTARFPRRHPPAPGRGCQALRSRCLSTDESRRRIGTELALTGEIKADPRLRA